jgi:hypothetical protein
MGLWKPPVPKTLSEFPVSLTSWQPRFGILPLVLLTLIRQSIRPQEVILWLSHDDARVFDPEVTTLFRPYGVRIAICDDLKSHKKWIPMVKYHPNKSFVICDDDILYPNQWFSQLIAADRSDGYVGLRAHKMTRDSKGEIQPYSQWKKLVSYTGVPSADHFITGAGGAIIHPRRLPPHCFDTQTILATCPGADDVWLNMAHIFSGFFPFKPRYSFPCLEIPGSGSSGLAVLNVDGGQNDVQIKNALQHFRTSSKWT